MSMTGRFQRLRTSVLEAIRSDPDLLQVLYPRDELEDMRAIHRQFGSEARFLEAVRRRPASFDTLGAELDIDKTWQAIHFLLTGNPWHTSGPCGQAILGGTEIGEDGGYGPARFLTADEVSNVDAALADVPRTELAERFDAEALNDADIYPRGWGADPDQELNWILSSYDELRAYYANATAARDAMLLRSAEGRRSLPR